MAKNEPAVVEEEVAEVTEETTPEVTPETTPETTSETVENEEETEETPEVEEETPEEKPPSRRESLRIQQLLSKIKQQHPAPSEPKALNYRESLNADDEVINQLENDRRNYGKSLYDEGLRQAQSMQFHTRLDIDAPKVEAKYPQLDKTSDKFDPAVADAINTQYLYLTGYDAKTDTAANPNIRYSDYVEATMELIERAAGRKVAQSSKNIAKQTAVTGLRPDGSSAKRLDLNKAPEDMSEEELKAVISQGLPK